MVTTPVDPIKPPSITLSQTEIEEIEDEIANGTLPRDFLDRHFEAVRRNVFGQDYKADGKGNPIEQGRGSAGNQTQQSVDAYKKWGKDEPDFERNLARMQKELAASEQRRAAERASAPKGRRFP